MGGNHTTEQSWRRAKLAEARALFPRPAESHGAGINQTLSQPRFDPSPDAEGGNVHSFHSAISTISEERDLGS